MTSHHRSSGRIRIRIFIVPLQVYKEIYLTVNYCGNRINNRLIFLERLERLVEKGCARRPSFKGRERTITSQTNNETVSEVTLGEHLRDRVKRIIIIEAFPPNVVIQF